MGIVIWNNGGHCVLVVVNEKDYLFSAMDNCWLVAKLKEIHWTL